MICLIMFGWTNDTQLNAFKELATPYRLFHHRLLITVVILTNRSCGYWIQVVAHLRNWNPIYKNTQSHSEWYYPHFVSLVWTSAGLLLLLLLVSYDATQSRLGSWCFIRSSLTIKIRSQAMMMSISISCAYGISYLSVSLGADNVTCFLPIPTATASTAAATAFCWLFYWLKRLNVLMSTGCWCWILILVSARWYAHSLGLLDLSNIRVICFEFAQGAPLMLMTNWCHMIWEYDYYFLSWLWKVGLISYFIFILYECVNYISF